MQENEDTFDLADAKVIIHPNMDTALQFVTALIRPSAWSRRLDAGE